jgi:hypothetical protein
MFEILILQDFERAHIQRTPRKYSLILRNNIIFIVDAVWDSQEAEY